ncbi:MAG: hypothetical protein ACOCRK_07470 [bacterium]
MKKLIILALVVAMFVTSSFSTLAKNNDQQRKNPKNKKQQVEFNDVIAEYEQYLVRNDDGTLSLPKDIAKKVDKQYRKYINEIKKGLNDTNNLIKEGYLVSDKNFNMIQVNESTTLFNDNSTFSVSSTSTNDGYHPIRGLHFYWWGFELGLTNNDIDIIGGLILIGEGASGIAAGMKQIGLIKVPVANKYIIGAAVVVLGCWSVVEGINKLGGNNGVYIRKTHLNSVPYVWYRHK